MNQLPHLTALSIAGLLLLGLCAGCIGGMAGIGGGLILVPALVLLFGLTQHVAQGTTLLLMLPPIGILSAWQYYREGYADIRIALLLMGGYLLGNYFGGRLSVNLPDIIIKKIFALLMLIISLKMLFFSSR